jgi:hypothetical protein
MQLRPTERREFGRRPCRIAGWIRTRQADLTACIVLDHSAGGAFLALDDPQVLPQRLVLVFPEHGIEILADARHRSRIGIGVQFVRGDVEAFETTFGTSAESTLPSGRLDARRACATRLGQAELRGEYLRLSEICPVVCGPSVDPEPVGAAVPWGARLPCGPLLLTWWRARRGTEGPAAPLDDDVAR